MVKRIRKCLNMTTLQYQRIEDLVAAIERASSMYFEQPSTLERIRRTAFGEIFSRHTWDRVLDDSYLPLYESVLADGSWTRK